MHRPTEKNTSGSAAKSACMLRGLAPKVLTLALAIFLIFACAAAAFAKSPDGLMSAALGKGAESTASAGDTTNTGASNGAGSTTTTGASDGSAQENSASQDGSEEPDPELERRKEIYSIGALITLGAIFVGFRERRRR